MTFNQFKEKFGWDFHLEYLADEAYWQTHEGAWDEYLRKEYIKHCKANGYKVVFD